MYGSRLPYIKCWNGKFPRLQESEAYAMLLYYDRERQNTIWRCSTMNDEPLYKVNLKVGVPQGWQLKPGRDGRISNPGVISSLSGIDIKPCVVSLAVFDIWNVFQECLFSLPTCWPSNAGDQGTPTCGRCESAGRECTKAHPYRIYKSKSPLSKIQKELSNFKKTSSQMTKLGCRLQMNVSEDYTGSKDKTDYIQWLSSMRPKELWITLMTMRPTPKGSHRQKPAGPNPPLRLTLSSTPRTNLQFHILHLTCTWHLG